MSNFKLTDFKPSVQEKLVRDNPQAFGVLPKLTTANAAQLKTCNPAKRLRQDTKPLLNKLEAEFQRYEEARIGEKLLPQALRFRLGNGIWYKPDFLRVRGISGRLMLYEVKGPHSFRGGFENLKVAAGLYRDMDWRLVWKQSGQWQTQDVLP